MCKPSSECSPLSSGGIFNKCSIVAQTISRYRTLCRWTLGPGAGAAQGKKRFSEFLTGLASVAEFEQFEPREFIAQRDKVVVNVFERARHKATGRAVDNDYVHIYTMRDGKITALRIFEDTAPLLAGMRSA